MRTVASSKNSIENRAYKPCYQKFQYRHRKEWFGLNVTISRQITTVTLYKISNSDIILRCSSGSIFREIS